MILEYQTFNKFGYYSKELSYGSNKQIVWRCNKCYSIRTRGFKSVRNLCQSCSNKSRALHKKNHCIDCRKEIVTLTAKRCIKCNGKFKKISVNNRFCINCGKTICEKSAGRCLKCSNALRQNPVLPHKCIECNNLVRVAKAKRCRTCANRLIAKNCDHKPTHGKHTVYKNVHFDSTWEANFAIWMDGSGIKWEFEPKGFRLKVNNKDTKYYPDFYLSEFDLWIEIKGYWRDDAKEKFSVFKKTYPNINIMVFEQNILRKFCIIK